MIKTLEKYLKDINLENNLIRASWQEFDEMMAKRRETQHFEKIINSFLSSIPDCQVIDMSELSEAFDAYMRKHKQETKTLEGLIE